MSNEPVIHRKQRRAVVIIDAPPLSVPAPAISESKAVRPVLKLKARQRAASNPEGTVETSTPAKPSKAVQEPLTAAERSRRQAAKAAAALDVLAAHYPALFASVRPMAIGTGKVLDAERKAGRLPLGCIPLKLALSAWTASQRYLESVAAGGYRFSLAGEAAGEVTPEQVAHAIKRLKKCCESASAALPHSLPG